MLAGPAIQTASADETMKVVLPAIAELLRQATGFAAHTAARPSATGDVRVSALVAFPDGVGTGELVATVFPYRGKLRVDIVLEHDRMIATSDGQGTGTPCFLNDYQTSFTLDLGSTGLSPKVVQRTVDGVHTALEGVQAHRRREGNRWGAIEVVRRSAVLAPPPVLTDAQAKELFAGPSSSVATEWEDDDIEDDEE